MHFPGVDQAVIAPGDPFQERELQLGPVERRVGPQSSRVLGHRGAAEHQHPHDLHCHTSPLHAALTTRSCPVVSRRQPTIRSETCDSAKAGHSGLLQAWLTSVLWDAVPQGGCCYTEGVPAEFKRDVVAVARRGEPTVAEVAVDFDVSQESVPRWVKQADVDDGVVAGLTSAEQSELVQLRRRAAVWPPLPDRRRLSSRRREPLASRALPGHPASTLCCQLAAKRAHGLERAQLTLDCVLAVLQLKGLWRTSADDSDGHGWIYGSEGWGFESLRAHDQKPRSGL